VRPRMECVAWARRAYGSLINAPSVACVAMMLTVTGCSTAVTNWESIQPTAVSGDRQWTRLTTGMTRTEFLNAMDSNGHSVFSWDEIGHPPRIDMHGIAMHGVSMTFYFPYAEYFFTTHYDDFMLLSTPVDASCTYSPDDGGSFESVFALTKNRTKELFANSAAPLGFLLGDDFPDEVDSRSWWTLRIWPSSIEEMLSVRFEEVTGGTKVIVNTESDQLVLKSRDKSFARSILEHMHCTDSLLSIGRVSSSAFDATTPIQLINGQEVRLSNYRVLSSVYAAAGAEVEFVVASDVVSDGNVVIRQGSPAWGEVLEYNRGAASIHIGLTRVQAIDGRWYGMAIESGPLVLEPIVDAGPEVVDKSKPVISSAHIVFPIGRIVTGVIDLGLTIDE